MEVKWLKDDKNEADIELDNLTIAEILRVYLSEDEAVSLAAWRREHPSKNPILKIRTKGKTAKKALSEAVAKIEKDADSLVSRFKKAK
jgi:DNA-directed RNA polymerase subunit L